MLRKGGQLALEAFDGKGQRMHLLGQLFMLGPYLFNIASEDGDGL